MYAPVAILWMTLTDPSGGQVFVSEDSIVSMRGIAIDSTGQYQVVGVDEAHARHCLLNLSNGRFLAVQESCGEIQEKLR